MLLVIVLVMMADPFFGWIMLPALLFGMLVAVVLRLSNRSALSTDEARGPGEIRIDSIRVSGGIIGGIFTLGTMAIFFAALHEVRWFFVFSLPCGILAGIFLHLWHARHPTG